PARSAFFRAGVRILDGDLATLALADGDAGLAPGSVALPRDAGVMQHRPDSVRADLGQTIRCAPQSALQGTQRPGRRAIALAIRRPPELGQNPFALLWTVLGRWSTTRLPFHRSQS